MASTKDLDAHYHKICLTNPTMRKIFPITNQDKESNDIRCPLKNTLLHTFTSIQQALISWAEGMERVISAIIKQQIKTVTRPKRLHTEAIAPRKRQRTQTTLTAWCGSKKNPKQTGHRTNKKAQPKHPNSTRLPSPQMHHCSS